MHLRPFHRDDPRVQGRVPAGTATGPTIDITVEDLHEYTKENLRLPEITDDSLGIFARARNVYVCEAAPCRGRSNPGAHSDRHARGV